MAISSYTMLISTAKLALTVIRYPTDYGLLSKVKEEMNLLSWIVFWSQTFAMNNLHLFILKKIYHHSQLWKTSQIPVVNVSVEGVIS